MVIVLLPALNDLTGRLFAIGELADGRLFLFILVALLLFGLAASLYPALLLTSFSTMNSLSRARLTPGRLFLQNLITPTSIRKILVTMQFSISVFLIIGTLVIFNQFRYVQSVNLGFNKEQVLVIDIPSDTSVSNHLDVVRNKLMEIPSVKDISITSSVPGSDHGALTMNVSQSGGSEIKVINTYMVDDRFSALLDLKLAEGRFFSREFSTDPNEAFVINEAAARFLGWGDQAIGKHIESPLGQKGTVVGVVRDFNYKSLHNAIEPIVLMNTINSQGYLMVRLATADYPAVIEEIRTAWALLDTGHPYEYFFLDDKFQSQYEKEERLLTTFTYLAFVAIFISCLGLMGLAMFTNELRVKEVGIRKTLGASIVEIMALLSGGFLRLILLANIIAWPVSYFIIRSWLDEFAYRVDPGALPFVSGALIAFSIAGATVGYFAFQAYRGKIVDALKQE
jgi:putative ABC transport system permease protein